MNHEFEDDFEKEQVQPPSPVQIMKAEDFTQDNEIKVIETDLINLQERSTLLKVIDAETQGMASDMRGEALAVVKKIEVRRKFFQKPRKIITDKINADAVLAKAPYEKIADALKTKYLAYEEVLVEEKRVAEEKERKRLDKEAEKLRLKNEAAAKQAETAGEDFTPDEYVPPIPTTSPVQVEKSTKTEKSTSFSTDHWKASVEDEKAFMKWAVEQGKFSFLKIHMPALNSLAKLEKDSQGVPGVRFWNDTGMTTRG